MNDHGDPLDVLIKFVSDPLLFLGAFSSTTLESDVGHGVGRCVQPLDGLSLEGFPGWSWDFV